MESIHLWKQTFALYRRKQYYYKNIHLQNSLDEVIRCQVCIISYVPVCCLYLQYILQNTTCYGMQYAMIKWLSNRTRAAYDVLRILLWNWMIYTSTDAGCCEDMVVAVRACVVCCILKSEQTWASGLRSAERYIEHNTSAAVRGLSMRSSPTEPIQHCEIKTTTSAGCVFASANLKQRSWWRDRDINSHVEPTQRGNRDYSSTTIQRSSKEQIWDAQVHTWCVVIV